MITLTNPKLVNSVPGGTNTAAYIYISLGE